MRGYLVEKYTDMKGAYTPTRLIEEANKLGIDLRMIGISDLTLEGYKVFFKGEVLPSSDFVIHRIKMGELKDKVGELSTYSFNRTDLLKKYISKKEQLEVLKGYVKYPKTSYSRDYDEVVKEVGIPFVAKGLYGSQGSEVELIHNRDDFEVFLGRFKECLAQEYISNSCGRDARLMVIKGVVVAGMERSNAHDFRANFARGGSVRKIEIDAAMRDIARVVYELTGVAVFGLDLLYGQEGYLFCELNVTPGIEGMEKATGVNVAGLIMEMILEEVSNQVISNEKEVMDFIYESYIKAKPFMQHLALDKDKRHPELTAPIIKSLDKTENIMVTGSKGKGSVGHMVSCLLQMKYDLVGLFTGPEVSDFKERFQVNDVLISSEDFVRISDAIAPVVRGIKLLDEEYVSPLGIELMIGLTYFNERHTDINVIECGKGVAYDDTNALERSYGVINPIFEEHVREMGNLLEIAKNKSYMIQQGMKGVFVGKQYPEVLSILEARSKQEQVPLWVYGRDFYAEHITMDLMGMKFDVVTRNHTYKDLTLGLVGRHQAENAALALALVEEKLGVLDDSLVKEAFKKVKYAGRMEVLSHHPLMILDNCINQVSAKLVEEVIQLMDYQHLKVVICIPEDKDYQGVYEVIKKYADKVIFTSIDNPHYHFSKTQAEVCGVAYVSDCSEAIEVAKEGSDVVVLLGTTAFVSEVKQRMEMPNEATLEA